MANKQQAYIFVRLDEELHEGDEAVDFFMRQEPEWSPVTEELIGVKLCDAQLDWPLVRRKVR